MRRENRRSNLQSSKHSTLFASRKASYLLFTKPRLTLNVATKAVPCFTGPNWPGFKLGRYHLGQDPQCQAHDPYSRTWLIISKSLGPCGSGRIISSPDSRSERPIRTRGRSTIIILVCLPHSRSSSFLDRQRLARPARPLDTLVIWRSGTIISFALCFG